MPKFSIRLDHLRGWAAPLLECRHAHARLSDVNVHRMHSRPLREDAFRGSVRQLVRLGDGLAGDLVVIDIQPVAQVRVL
jgi:hypothetical protein